MTISRKDYYPQGARVFTPIEKEPRVLKSGTNIRNYTVGLNGQDGYIGSQKRINQGADTALKDLGVDRVTITRVKGQKEPMISFLSPIDMKRGFTQRINFLKKTDHNQMKAFIEILKDYAKNGVKPDFGVIADILKHIK